MKATNFELFFICVICCSRISDSSSVVKNVGVDAMEKLASGCEKFILIKDGMNEKIYDFYFSGSGDFLNFFDKLDNYLEKESKADATFAKMARYFYVCMNDASKGTLKQLEAFFECLATHRLEDGQGELYKRLLKIIGEHLSDGQIQKSLRKELENSTHEELLHCLTKKNN